MSNHIRELESQLQRELGRAVIGNRAAIRALTVALTARGHVLLQGAPGLGKTLLARSVAAVIGGSFRRVQGTADLMPADIIGVSIYDEVARQFVFHPGPLFADVVLVDEINRAGPKTQSALLEAMAERQVSTEQGVQKLDPNFLVIATQNPHEFEGTFPLPESQLDRFMLCVNLLYPPADEEVQILERYGATMTETVSLPQMRIVEADLLSAARDEAEGMHVSPALHSYVIALANATRERTDIAVGLSSRGALALLRAARVVAGLRGGDFVTPEDVKEAAPWVIGHRLSLGAEAALRAVSAQQIIDEVLGATPVPR
ncbi:MAG: MoxR family ATPase [Steroidobacteraceae bacterium]